MNVMALYCKNSDDGGDRKRGGGPDRCQAGAPAGSWRARRPPLLWAGPGLCVYGTGLTPHLRGGLGQTPPPPVFVLFVRGIFLPY